MWDPELDRYQELASAKAADNEFSFRGGSLLVSTNEEKFSQGGESAIVAATTTASVVNGTNDCKSDKKNEDLSGNSAMGIEESLPMENSTALEDLCVKQESGKFIATEMGLSEPIIKSLELENDSRCLSPSRIMLECVELGTSSHVIAESEGGDAFSSEKNGLCDTKDATSPPERMVLGSCSEMNLHNSIEPVCVHKGQDNSEAVPLSGITDDNLERATMTLCANFFDDLTREKVSSVISHDEEKNARVFNCMESKDGLENEMQKNSRVSEKVSSLLKIFPKCGTDESSPLHSSYLSSTLAGTHGGLDATASVTAPMVRRRNPARHISIRKSDQAPKSRSNARKSKKTSRIHMSLVEALRATSSNVTKKRLNSPKCSRISVWGALENLLKKFKCDDEPLRSKKKGFKKQRSRKGKKCSVNSRLNEVGSTKAENLPEKTERQISLSSNQDESVALSSNDCNGSLTPVIASESKFETGGSIFRPSPCFSHHFDNRTLSHEPSPQNGDRDQESSLTQEASEENTLSDSHGIQSHVLKGESVDVTDERLLLDPNTSPDSGVIHPSVVGGNAEDQCRNPTRIESSSIGGSTVFSVCELGSPVVENFSEAAMSVSLRYTRRQASGSREKRSVKLNGLEDINAGENGCLLSGDSSEGTSLDPSNLNKSEKAPRKSHGRRKKDCFVQRISGKGSIDVENPNCFQAEDSTCKKETWVENPASSSAELIFRDAESTILHTLPSTSSGQLQKSNGISCNTARRRKQNGASRKMDASKRSNGKGRPKQKIPHVQSSFMEESQMNDILQEKNENTYHLICDTYKSLSSGKADGSSDGCNEPPSCNDEVPSTGLNAGAEAQVLRERAAWVCCDDCYKWRSIAVELADAIDETGCRWTCKDNRNKAFGDCSIPQEKTNAEINAELEISDASSEEDFYAKKRFTSVSDLKPPAVQQSAWVHINSNIFLHRARKTQTIDEIMVCQCKCPLDGSLGCGDECLNRMLNIECTPETCPCGNLCSNQQFQKREYARFKYYRCGKKGFGLKLSEDVRQGQFLIEYVGEVLDVAAHEARQIEYAARGQKHFYFMTLNGNEVIDACAKGNLGRFINHSCEPNCRTEKWMINGEVCVGLFATRNIKKGEEVTFDYNYVRVFGAAAKRCLCGSKECRGYIGGDPSNNELLVHSDSDEEHPEPVMISENGEQIIELAEENSESTDSVSSPHTKEMSKAGDNVIRSVNFSPPKDGTLHEISSVGQSSETLTLEVKDVDQVSKDLLPDGEKPKASKSPSDSKSHSSSEMKKRRFKTKKSMAHKEKIPSFVSHNQPAVCRSGHHESVEEKLNELLDSRGGINKHRDATKGYLKLLVFSATSGDETKIETSQSTRDLSLILDALLKTKSRTVLVDVINKNGLQLLHNMMKQNRRNFSRIPVIRKLLKVLEFLAGKEIITPEHMSYLPSNAEVESFKESILKLTYHNDVQVHQMARKFRDRWLPRKPKRVDSDRSNPKRQKSNWFPQYPSNRVNIDQTPVPVPEVNPCRPRKRKSRWDQQQWPIPEVSGQTESDPQMIKSGAPESALEVPPGFGPPPLQPAIGIDLSGIRVSALMGHPQEQYQAHLSVSYGIPLTLAEQLGSGVDQGRLLESQRLPSWEVAPGMPFYPFPPLPSVPRSLG